MNAAFPGEVEIRAKALPLRRRSTFILIGVFWLFTVAMLSIRGELVESPPFLVMTPRRLAIALFGTWLCLAMVLSLDRLRTRSFPERIAWGVAGAFVMAFLLTAFATLLNRVMLSTPGLPPLNWGETAQWTMLWLGYCLAWISAHLALTYHWEAQEQRDHILQVNMLAQEARVAALRYQINPHFLFNTLNAISGLVMDRRNDEAETMLVNLSAFLRCTLATDPNRAIELKEEIALQLLYLAIEEARFSERMRVDVDIPEELATSAVPALILQPLVENAVRYAVGASETMTTIRIAAEREDGELRLIVEDDGGDGEIPVGGTGLGLTNVRERLQAQFGRRGRLAAGRMPQGGYRAEIALPWTAQA